MIRRLRQESELFFNALRFFTRLPVPAWVSHSAESLNHAARHFPLVGLLVGIAGAGVFLLASMGLPLTLAVAASMAVTVVLTGAFHEDGFADVCDGFGGGWDKAQILAIMKDSRIGAYGTIGMVMMFGTKFLALLDLGKEGVVVALIIAHPLSRLASTTLIYALDYVRDDASSRAKPLAHRLSTGELAWAALCGLAPLTLLAPVAAARVLGLAALTTWLAARFFLRRIGGYTGDCLGATQQLAELAIYLGLAWNFT